MPGYKRHVEKGFEDMASYLGQLQNEVEPGVTYYLALGTPMGREIQGRGYARQPIRFSVRQDGTKISSIPQVFQDLPKAFVTQVSVWSAQHNGVRVWSGHTDGALDIGEGTNVYFETGSINAV